MSYYEYRVVPAPKSLPKVKGVKGPEGRFAYSMAEALNAEGRGGWEFQRSETIETEMRRGFLSKRARMPLTVLVFRRWVETEETPEPVEATRAAPSVVMSPAADPQEERPFPAPEEIEQGSTDEDRPVFTARRGDAARDVPPLSGSTRE